MRFVLAFIVAVVLLLGVTYYRYGAMYSEDGRAIRLAREDCLRARGAPTYVQPSGIQSSEERACEDSARRVVMGDETRHYLLGAWLWGAVAALLGGLLTYVFVGRRQRRVASIPPPGLGA